MAPTLSTRGLGRIGVIVPSSNGNAEPDLAMQCPPGVSIHAVRVGGYDVDDIPDADEMSAFAGTSIDHELRLLKTVRPDIATYACTSATMVSGFEYDCQFARKLEAMLGCPTVTAGGSIAEALADLNVRTIGFCSPYTPAVHKAAIDFFAQGGFVTVSDKRVEGQLRSHGMTDMSLDDVFELATKANSPEAEAIVMSCTDMRSVEVIDAVEAETGKPVVSSNQAMMYCALKRRKDLAVGAKIPGRLGALLLLN